MSDEYLKSYQEIYNVLVENPYNLKVYYKIIPEEAKGTDFLFFTNTNVTNTFFADDKPQLMFETFLIRHFYKEQDKDLSSWFIYEAEFPKSGIVKKTASNLGITNQEDIFQDYFQDDYTVEVEIKRNK